MAQSSFEDYLDKVAADNDLTNIALGRMVVGERIVRTAIVHYTGHANDGIGCSSGSSDTCAREALYEALQKAAKNRAPTAVVPCAVPAPMQVAA